MLMRIGIFGGSFDPVHNEHIKIAQNAVKSLGLDILYVVPAKAPPHKVGVTLCDGNHRKKMLEITFCNQPNVVVSDFELESQNTSYTYLTVEHFAKIHQGAQLYLLIGADMLENFPLWREPERILSMARLFVTRRGGEDFIKASTAYMQRFNNADFIVSDIDGLKVSSTEIRNRLMLGLDVDDFLDPSVLQYIKENGLYLGGKEALFVRTNLTKKRLMHTLGVMNLAKTYAKRLGVDTEKAVMAAMLHDAAKYLNHKDYPDFKVDSDVPQNVIHQFLGAHIAKNLLGVWDDDIINAIKYHTTGRPGMGVLEKIIFTADLLEDGRDYEEAPLLRKAVDKDFYEGFKLCVNRLIAYLLKENSPIYHLTLDCLKYYQTEK